MNLNEFKLLHEDDTCYTVSHPNGRSLRVEKKGLNPKAQKMIEKWKGAKGYFDGDDDNLVSAEAAPIPQALMKTEDLPVAPSVSQDGVLQGITPVAPQASIPIGNSDVKSSAPQEMSTDNPQGMMAAKEGSVEDALKSQKSALGAEANAQAVQGKKEARAIGETQDQIDDMPTQQDIMNDYKVKDDSLMRSFQNKTIDPERFYKNQSAGSKIASGIALFLGGMGSGLTGQPNAAAEMLKTFVERDIDAQKNDQSKAMNAWKMNREALGSDLAANLATQNQLYTGLKYNLMKAGAEAQGPVALARAQGGMSLLDQQMAQNRFQLSLIQQGMGTNTNNKFSGQDPSILVPQLVKEPGAQKAVFEEIKNASNVANNGPKIMDAFDAAAKDNTVMKTGAGLLRTPGSVMSLHQLMLPNFKTIDGTVRQAAMDESFHNLTPSPGDSEEKISEKRQALQDWMHSESAAPTAKGFGIDLSKFKNTAVQNSSSNEMVRKFMANNPQVQNEQQAISILKKHGKL